MSDLLNDVSDSAVLILIGRPFYCFAPLYLKHLKISVRGFGRLNLFVASLI